MSNLKWIGITATQTGDVPMDVWNNEMKHIDRSNTEGDRTLVKPYSFCIYWKYYNAREER